MTQWLNEDQQQVRDLVHRVAREKVAARAQAIDRTAEYPQDMFDMLRDLGLFTLPFPAEYGGAGSLLSACVAVEELGRVCYNTAYLLVLQWVPIGAILAGGSKAQKERYLPGLEQRRHARRFLAHRNRRGGSDRRGHPARAVRAGAGYRLTRTEDLVHQLRQCGFRAGGRAHRNGSDARKINMFLVEKGTPGFEVGAKEDWRWAHAASAPMPCFEQRLHSRGETGSATRDRVQRRPWRR